MAQLSSNKIEGIMEQHHIKHIKYTPYHPQENGRAEVTNRDLEKNLTKVVNNSKNDHIAKLVEATCTYSTTWKTNTRFSPLELVYGKKAHMSIEFRYNTLRMKM